MREIFSKLSRDSRPGSSGGGRHSKQGFGLIELLVVMLILSVLAGLIVIGVGNVFAKAGDGAYDETRHQIEIAVLDYMARTGNRPVTSDIVQIDGLNYGIIDICILQMSYSGSDGPGILRQIPLSCVDAINDNCDNASCMGNISSDAGGCDPRAHYIWAATLNGGVKSTCIGPDCDASNADGYQGIWP